jgi:hypothetical protein
LDPVAVALSIPRVSFVGGVDDETVVVALGTRHKEGSLMAQYVILIYEREAGWAEASEAESQAGMDAHNRFPEQAEKLGGKVVGGHALQGVATATTIRDDVVTDGPFAETKEALGGFYLIEAEDLDQALAIAKMCPAPYGGVEVRPVQVYE